MGDWKHGVITKVEVLFPQATLATLEVYDLLGIKVATLTREKFETGYTRGRVGCTRICQRCVSLSPAGRRFCGDEEPVAATLSHQLEANMKQRNPFAVFILPFVTFGIYGIVWYVQTKDEMNAHGAAIPTAWLLVVPFANLYWWWKYAKGVEAVTKGSHGAFGNFLLRLFLGSIGMAITQSAFNKVAR